MVTPTAGEVVLVPFPFSDLSQTKVRPAICLAETGRGDWILCQITSSRYGDSSAISLGSSDFSIGGLRIASYARPGKLFTAHFSLMAKSVGKLKASSLLKLLDAVVQIIRPENSP